MKSLVIVDSMNILHRCFYNKSGFNGYVSYLKKVFSKYMPSAMIVCSDFKRTCFRNEIYSEYKKNRSEHPIELDNLAMIVEKYLKAIGVPFLKAKKYEADDLIGSISKQAPKFGYNSYLLSGDTDLYQLINSNTNYLYIDAKRGILLMREDEAFNKFSIPPSQYIDFKSLTGDTSDNIPGAKGIGKINALKLLSKYQTLENIFKSNGKYEDKVNSDKESVLLSKKLVTIKTDINMNYEELFEKSQSKHFIKNLNKNPKTFIE